MKRFHRRVRALIPTLVIGSVLLASYWNGGVSARKAHVDGARASLPAVKREPIDERAAHALRAGMPALRSVAFEANEGQADRAVKFLARSDGHQLLLTSHSII